MKTINQIFNLRLLALLFAVITIASCGDDDNGVEAPEEENEVEVFTDVTLIFTPEEGDVVMATAQDPDGEGIQGLIVEDEIVLAANTTYTLTYEILNALDPDDVEDIGEEILEEDNEHQFFYSFSDDIFASPMGNGNIDNSGDPINYDDEDENGLDVGLVTSWTTGDATTGDFTFTANLQHQPAVDGVVVKTATSTAQDGDTDFFLTFDLVIQ